MKCQNFEITKKNSINKTVIDEIASVRLLINNHWSCIDKKSTYHESFDVFHHHGSQVIKANTQNHHQTRILFIYLMIFLNR